MTAEFERFSHSSGAYPQGYPQKMGTRRLDQPVPEISAEFQRLPPLFRRKGEGVGSIAKEGSPLFPLDAASHAGVLDLVDGSAGKDCIDRRA